MANFKRRSRRTDKRRYYPCGCCVDRRANNKLRRHDYVDDDPSNGKVRSKRKRPKKVKLGPKCRHEWYREDMQETRYSIECGKPDCNLWHNSWGANGEYCMDWKAPGGEKYRWREKVPYVVTWEQATCINCWEVRKYNVLDPTQWGNPAYRSPYRRKYPRPWKPRTAYRKPKA
jgi:hypothetical protein